MSRLQDVIRVALFDDNYQVHKMVAALLLSTPDISLVGQGANGHEAIDICDQLHPDVVLMDVLMPDMNGVEATRRLRERFPDVRILVLSSLQDHESVSEMLKLGAVGYITKNSLAHDLAETIRATHLGKVVFSADAFSQLMSRSSSSSENSFGLTSREVEVLGMMAKGWNMPEIAEKLKISQSTVKFHLGNICSKMGVHTRSEALILAAKNNLV